MMQVARSTYYYRPRPSPESKRIADANLRDAIEKIALEWPQYGYRRVTAELRRNGLKVNHKKVARILKEESLQCQVKRKFLRPKNRVTGKERYLFAQNLTKGLVVRGPNQVWVADITYIRLEQEFVFLAVVLDVYSRRVIGWAISQAMQVDLTLAALKMAILTRKPKPGCIHHSDRGGQYASSRYVGVLKEAGLKPSMSRPGYPYDNAVVESFIKTLKQEEVDCTEYKNLDDLQGRIPYFIDKIYNQKRLHSKLGYMPPAEYEKKPVRYKPATYINLR